MKRLEAYTMKDKELLTKIFIKMKDFSNTFRDRICIECNWTHCTFYRKVKKNEKLSGADRSMLKNISLEMINEILEIISTDS